MIRALLHTISMLFFLVLISEISIAQQVQFDHANELMEEQRIEEAFEVYRTIESNGYQSGKLYYNMAIAAIYQDSLGLAKYYLMQSVKYPDVHEDAERTLYFINEQFNRRSAILPKLPWERFFEWLENRFGAVLLMVFGILLLNLGVGGIIGSWFAERASIWLKRTGYAAGILSIMLIGFSFYLQYLNERFETAVMVDRQTVVHERPQISSSSVNTAYEGYTMRVDAKISEAEENWYYVRLQNGMYGWIERDKVRTF